MEDRRTAFSACGGLRRAIAFATAGFITPEQASVSARTGRGSGGIDLNSKHLSRAAWLIAVTVLASTPSVFASPVDTSSYSDLRWRQIGPFRGGWSTVVTGVPTKPDRFYFGAAGGGVWRTDDAGR